MAQTRGDSRGATKSEGLTVIRKPLDLPPAVARGFVDAVRAFFWETCVGSRHDLIHSLRSPLS
jgi:hypothetical protein